jgi:hypothetical protein
MKLTAHGSSINYGDKIFMKADLSGAPVTSSYDADSYVRWPKAAIEINGDPEIRIKFEAEGQRLDSRSRYTFSLELTKADVVRLFWETFKYESFHFVLAILGEVRPKKAASMRKAEKTASELSANVSM